MNKAKRKRPMSSAEKACYATALAGIYLVSPQGFGDKAGAHILRIISFNTVWLIAFALLALRDVRSVQWRMRLRLLEPYVAPLAVLFSALILSTHPYFETEWRQVAALFTGFALVGVTLWKDKISWMQKPGRSHSVIAVAALSHFMIVARWLQY